MPPFCLQTARGNAARSPLALARPSVCFYEVEPTIAFTNLIIGIRPQNLIAAGKVFEDLFEVSLRMAIHYA